MDALTLPPARPVSLPRLNANQAQALTQIARHGAAVALTLPPAPQAGGQAAPVRWLLAFASGAPEPVRAAATWHADLEWAGAAVRLHLPEAAAQAWLAARLPGLPAPVLPQALQAAAFETLLQEALAALAQAGAGGPVRVQALQAGAARALAHAWTVTLHAPDTGALCHAVLETDGLGLMLLAALLGKAAPARRDAQALAALPIRLRAVLGHTRLPLAELRALGPGDVVLLDHYRVGADGALWLEAGQGQALRVRAEGSHYIVTKGWTSLMTQESTERPEPIAAAQQAGAAAPDAPAPLALEAIPVQLSFDLGERSIALAELQRLQPGEVFDLHRPLADGPVMIRANGALVGTGTLVEVDGRIGVMVQAWGPAGAAMPAAPASAAADAVRHAS
ncbi:type III secretion system cytoplasmic ring protein SctQ [Orrella sp. JC864]|uniref:type III secretion system cytoplasmic ring protein SctQ n=1 Tax=Orrella sp. JC864 TaxID=3120298 RepID=UPI0030080BF0